MSRTLIVGVISLLLASCATNGNYLNDLQSPGLRSAMEAMQKNDAQRAVMLLKVEAERGNGIAQGMVARTYGAIAEKSGSGDDLVQAYKWIELACNKGVLYDKLPSAQKEDIAYRDQLASKMTSEQIATAKTLAKEWKPISP
jgi:TPR repeat protein